MLMEAGESILLFPGGAQEVFRDERHERYSLRWGRRQGFARMAIEHGYTIVPFASIGFEDVVRVAFSISSSWFWKMIGDKKRAEQNAYDAPNSTRLPVVVPSWKHSDLFISFGEAIVPPPASSPSFDTDVWKFRELVRERVEDLISNTREWRDVETCG
jgi:1-acyl-sn-glycerol-3-phosphate acyltransferase